MTGGDVALDRDRPAIELPPYGVCILTARSEPGVAAMAGAAPRHQVR